MALKATILKADIQISDMDRNYYQSHNITLAQHPSETDERVMNRLLAFALNANDQLEFCKGLSTDDEPDLWEKTLSDEIKLWIDLGQLDEKRIRKACNRAENTIIYTYQSRNVSVWWKQIQNKLTRFNNLSIYQLADEFSHALTTLFSRNMELQFTIQDGLIWVSDGDKSIEIQMTQLK